MIDKNLFETIFEKNFDSIYKYFYFRTLSKEDSEDLTSDTFFRFLKKIKSDIEVENYEKYLYGIARFVFADFLRNKYRENTITVSDPDIFDTEMQAVTNNQVDLTEFLSKLINSLPEHQAVIIRLRLIEKNSLDEISTSIGKDKNYIKTTQRRAVENLKKLVACTPLTT